MATGSAEQQIFDACLALAAQDRLDFIRRSCTGHPELAQRLYRLLEAHEKAEAAGLDVPPVELAAAPPDRIGSYRLLNVIGEGGMGVVYRAEQLYPVRREVALKLIRWGMDSRQVVARFETERQALAVMDHPNIAKVLDAGATPEGRPFFVMEMVPGVPLTTFCDRERLSLRQRLRLFVALAGAVQHAHQKGVIHRDLKPSNVLVAIQDGHAVLKVIDFGIAKAVGSQFGNLTRVTQAGTALGTPAYMSPEQAETAKLDIDTRSDIYSLGVILYELTIGVLPVSPEEVGLAAFLAQLANPEIDPTLPSVRLIQMGDRAGSVAADRRTVVSDLVRELAGDLDWLIRKAIDKDRDGRYESADALAADVNRYLRDEPLAARPPTFVYRCRKFLRRHRPVVAAAAVALVALVVGVVGVLAGLVQAERSREEALRQAVKATEAEKDANSRLRHALVAQARALRGSQTPGRRQESLRLLAQAAVLRPGPDLTDEGISSATLTDLERVASWPNLDGRRLSIDFDSRFERHAWGLVGGDVEILLNDDDEEAVRVLPGFGLDPWLLRFSPDGRRLAVKYHGASSESGGCVRVWDPLSGNLEVELPFLPVGAAMVFSPDGNELALVDEARHLIFFDLRSNRARVRVKLDHYSSDLDYRPDGRAVAVSTDEGGIEVRSVSDGQILRRLVRPGRVFRTDWSRDGTLLAGGYSDGTAVIWQVRDGRVLSTLKGHQAEVVRVGFHPKLPLAFTYSWDETTRLWEAETGKQLLAASAQALEFSRDGRFLSFVDGDAAGFWRLQHGDLLHTYYGHEGKGPRCLDLSFDGRRIVSGGLDGVLLWDSQSEDPVAVLPTPNVRNAFFIEDEQRLISCGAEGLISWNVPGEAGGRRGDGRRILTDNPCFYAALGADRKTLVSIHPDRVIYLWPDGENAGPRRLEGFPGMAHPSVTAGGGLVAAGNWRGDRTVVWDGRNGRPLRDILQGQTSVGVLFGPQGRWLVTGTSEEYLLWTTTGWDSFMRIHRPPRFSNLPGLMAFNDSGTLLAVILDNRTVGVFDPSRRRQILRLQLPDPQGFSEIRFSGDGSRLGVATTAHRIHVWNIRRILEELQPLGLDFGLAAKWPQLSSQRVAGPLLTLDAKGSGGGFELGTPGLVMDTAKSRREPIEASISH